MARTYVVNRAQITVVDVDEFDVAEDENGAKMAEEIAVELNDWETVDIYAEPS